MTGEVNYIKAYWRPRAESTHDCAMRLARMLGGLAMAHPAFARWNEQADTRVAANKPAWVMPPDIEELTAVFEKGRQYKDEPRVPWPEMGYSVSAWNGRDPPHGVSLILHSGTYADWIPFPNTIDLSLSRVGGDNTDLISVAVLKPALLNVAMAWEPDYAVVVPWTYWPRSFEGSDYPNLRSGWMIYLAPQYAERMVPPPVAIVEPAVRGGMLLLATEQQFDMENPAHLAAADAIQIALEPLQSMIPPGRDEHLRRRQKDKGLPL